MAPKVSFCPKCRKAVEAKEYFSTEGGSDWRVESVGTTIRCTKCGYSGPPAEASAEDFKKLENKK